MTSQQSLQFFLMGHQWRKGLDIGVRPSHGSYCQDAIQLWRQVYRKSRPHWNLHLVLLVLCVAAVALARDNLADRMHNLNGGCWKLLFCCCWLQHSEVHIYMLCVWLQIIWCLGRDQPVRSQHFTGTRILARSSCQSSFCMDQCPRHQSTQSLWQREDVLSCQTVVPVVINTRQTPGGSQGHVSSCTGTSWFMTFFRATFHDRVLRW